MRLGVRAPVSAGTPAPSLSVAMRGAMRAVMRGRASDPAPAQSQQDRTQKELAGSREPGLEPAMLEWSREPALNWKTRNRMARRRTSQDRQGPKRMGPKRMGPKPTDPKRRNPSRTNPIGLDQAWGRPLELSRSLWKWAPVLRDRRRTPGRPRHPSSVSLRIAAGLAMDSARS
jgi:hypothetical protein